MHPFVELRLAPLLCSETLGVCTFKSGQTFTNHASHCQENSVVGFINTGLHLLLIYVDVVGIKCIVKGLSQDDDIKKENARLCCHVRKLCCWVVARHSSSQEVLAQV